MARSRHRSRTLWAASGAALGIHALLLGSAAVFGASLVGMTDSGATAAGNPGKAKPVEPPPALAASCSGDVLLATSARAMMCLAPWQDNVPGCGDDVQTSMWIDLSSCRRGNEPLAEIALVQPKTVEHITPIDPEKLLEEMAQPPPPQPKPPEIQPPQPQVAQQPPPPPPPQQRPAQVIETVKPNDEKEPENARFLAEYNTSVEHQKVNRGARDEPMVAKAKDENLTAVPKPPDEDPQTAKPPADRQVGKNEKAPDLPGPLSMRKPGAISPNEVAQDPHQRGANDGTTAAAGAGGITPQKGDGHIEQQRHDPGEISQGQGGAGGGAPQLPDLQKNKDVLERIAGGGSVDHLDDIEEGDESSLSAKKWVYASFFNRLKRQVAQNWDPQSVWRRTDPDGTKHGIKTRITEVKVTLSATGALTKVVVTNPSGVEELDEEALRAFKAAAPFVNPPEGLLAGKNEITFAFSFFFEIGAPRTSWRFTGQ